MHATATDVGPETAAPFSAALVLQSLGGAEGGTRTFGAMLSSSWTIGPKAHGGILLALCANAAAQAVGGVSAAVQPLAVSASYLSPPEPGEVQLRTEVHKRGRTVSLVDVELRQAGRGAVRATVTLGPAESGAAAFVRAHPVQTMPVEPPPGAVDIRAHPLGQIVANRDGLRAEHGRVHRGVSAGRGRRRPDHPPVGAAKGRGTGRALRADGR